MNNLINDLIKYKKEYFKVSVKSIFLRLNLKRIFWDTIKAEKKFQSNRFV